MDVSTIAVPVAYTAILMHLFEALKMYVLEPYVPGFRAQDAGHDRDLRLAFFALVFAGVLGFALSGQAGVPVPTDFAGWLLLMYAVANSALALMAGAHVTYQALWTQGHGPLDSGGLMRSVPMNAAAVAATEDYPPAAPSAEALGLPTT